MGYNAFRAAAEDKLRDNWTTTPIVYEDVPYRPTAEGSFVKIITLGGVTEQITIGASNNCFRSDDIIQIEINVKGESGTNTIGQYADSIIGIFKGQELSDGTVIRGYSGPYKDTVEGYSRWILSFYCWRDET